MPAATTPEVDVDKLATALEQGATLVDVREPAEYLQVRVPGAILIPMAQLSSRVGEITPEQPVYVICASGNRSKAMTDLLIAQGLRAWSVAGGTSAWARSGRSVEFGRPRDISVVAIDTPTLGDRSYLVHDGDVAFVVDPQRDVDRVLDLLEEHHVRLTHVFETHLHNDYVTGGFALAGLTGAAYHVNADDEVSFDRSPVRDGDVLDISNRIRVRVVATPGHTFTHLSFVLLDRLTGRQVAVFSGGSLLYGATGRPDLLGPDHTDELVRLQHASAHRLAAELPDAAEVYPTHGFGSFCSATQSEATHSTIGDERSANPVLTQDQETYVRELLAGLGAHPAYYAHMAPANAAGPAAPDLSPAHQADPAEIRARIEAGEWVVDLRDRSVFAAGHVPGSLNFGLDGSFATYLGWLVEWGAPLTLLGATPDDVLTAQRELVRIGIERPAATAHGEPEDWTDGPLGRFPRATFADLAGLRHHRWVTVLDVRRTEEHAESRIAGALHIPVHELPARLREVPAGEVWVHCAGGYRASVAASFLAAGGHQVVAVDDDFEHAAEVGLHLVGPEAA